MANVYSAQLWALSSAVGTINGPTVPTGFVFVVRDISLTFGGQFLSQVGGVVIYSNATNVIAAFPRNQCYGGATFYWRGHVVLNENDILGAVISPPSSASWLMSGYRLTLP